MFPLFVSAIGFLLDFGTRTDPATERFCGMPLGVKLCDTRNEGQAAMCLQKLWLVDYSGRTVVSETRL